MLAARAPGRLPPALRLPTVVCTSPDCLVWQSPAYGHGARCRFIARERRSPIPRNPAPLVTIQDLLDEIQEALRSGNDQRIRELQEELARTYDQVAAAQSLERNGMTRYTKQLLARMGWKVIAI